MNIKECFKPIFPLFLTRPLRKLTFLIPTVDFAKLMLVAKLYLNATSRSLHVDIAIDLWYSIYNVREEVTLKLRN